jgi:hypothetical protein
MSQRTKTVTTSTMMVTILPTSQTLIVLTVPFLFRQAVPERMLLAVRGALVAEDAVAVVAGRVVPVPVHLRAAVIDRSYITHHQKDRAFARSFCLCREWRS